MTLSITHATVALGPPDPDKPAEIESAEWNAAHTITGTANKVIGLGSGGSATEITNLTSDGTNITGLRLKTTASIDWDDGAGNVNLSIFRETANAAAQRNGTNAQAYHVYITHTDGSNYRRLTTGEVPFSVSGSSGRYGFSSSNAGTGGAVSFDIGTQDAGFVNFFTSSVFRWQITDVGDLICFANNTYDIGDSAGSKRPRTVYAATSVVAPVYNWDDGAGNIDLSIFRETANAAAQRNGLNAQAYHMYITYTDGSNYRRLTTGAIPFSVSGSSGRYGFSSSNAGTGGAVSFDIGTQDTGFVNFFTNSTFRWQITDDGHLICFANDTHDIGDSAATKRPRTVYAATSVVAPTFQTPDTTVGSLPAAGAGNKGQRRHVTDANATTFLSIVAGGGANVVPVFSNGTNWVIG